MQGDGTDNRVYSLQYISTFQMIMGTPKFDNIKTLVAVRVTFFLLICMVARSENYSRERGLVSNHWQEPRRIPLKSTMLNRLSRVQVV